MAIILCPEPALHDDRPMTFLSFTRDASNTLRR
jgi:hypothetical protein